MPEFVSSKAENEWDEDEKKAYEDYEKKTVELDERKEAYKKVTLICRNPRHQEVVITVSHERCPCSRWKLN